MEDNNKKKTRRIIKNITVELLDSLLGVAEGFVVSMDRREARKVIYGEYEKELTVANISKYFYSLFHRGYVETKVTKQGKESIVLTNKAKIILLDKIAEKIPKDKRFYLVSFDIPERLRRNRDLFRRSIKRLGFVELQKSLWVSNKNCGEIIDMLTGEYGVSDYVVYFVSDITNASNSVKKLLKK